MNENNAADLKLKIKSNKLESYSTELINTLYNYRIILAYAPAENAKPRTSLI